MVRLRSWRRHQRSKYLKKSKNFFKYIAGYMAGVSTAHKRETARCPCSKHCCGNPRLHYNEKTIQERRFLSESMEDNDA